MIYRPGMNKKRSIFILPGPESCPARVYLAPHPGSSFLAHSHSQPLCANPPQNKIGH